jgi:hypothetical protein
MFAILGALLYSEREEGNYKIQVRMKPGEE